MMTLSCTVIRWIYPDVAKIDIGQTGAHQIRRIATHVSSDAESHTHGVSLADRTAREFDQPSL
jgi:hypothetical protein